MKSIDEHIKKDQSEIASAKEEGNLPKVRHLTEELKAVSYTHLTLPTNREV